MRMQAPIQFNLIIPYIHVSQEFPSNPITPAIGTVAKPVAPSLWPWLMSEWPSGNFFINTESSCGPNLHVRLPDHLFFFFSFPSVAASAQLQLV